MLLLAGEVARRALVPTHAFSPSVPAHPFHKLVEIFSTLRTICPLASLAMDQRVKAISWAKTAHD